MTQPAEIQPPPPAAPVPPPSPASAGPDLVGVSALKSLQDPSSATSLYSAGKLGFHADERVPVRLADGKIGTVPGSEVGQAIDGGAQIVHPDEVHRAEQEAKFGGAASAAGAGVAGFGRGLTVGLSDPLTLAGAYAFGGQKSEDEMRERLNAYRELHPVASTVGEVAGIAAPAFLTGGTAAAAEGAGLAVRGAEAGRGLLAAAAAPMEGVSLVGSGARALATRVVGEGAETLAKRIAQKAVTGAAVGAAEGALFGAGQEVSEASLGNHELSGEKLWASMGHGAVMGGLVAGGLGALGAAGAPLLDKIKAKASPYLAAKAEEEAVKATNATVRFIRKMEKIPGGSRAVGRDILVRSGMVEGDTVETLAPKLDKLREADFQAIEGHVSKVADATMSLEDVIAPLEKRAAATEKELGRESAAGTIRTQIENLKRMFTPGGKEALEEIEGLRAPKTPAMPKEPPKVNPALAGKETKYALDLADTNAGAIERAESMPGTLAHEQPPIKIDMTRPGHIGDGVFLDPAMREGTHIGESPIGMRVDEAATKASREAPINANRTHRLESFADELAAREAKIAKLTAAHDARVAAINPKNIRVSIGDLLEQRRSFEGTIDWQREGSVITDAKRAVGRTLEDTIVEAGEKAAAERGLTHGFADEYQQLKLNFRRSKVASDAAADAVSRAEANAGHSLTDKIAGGHGLQAGLMDGIMSGHLAAGGILGMAAGAAAGAVSKVVRTRGNSTLAVTFDKLASLQAIAKRSDAIDAQLARGVRGFMKRAEGVEAGAAAKPAGKSVRIGTISRGKDAREEYEQQVAAVKGAAVADHGPISADLAKHAPMTAAVAASRAAGASAWLATQVPVPPKWGTQTATIQEMQDFGAKYAAVNDPAATLAHGLQHGGLTKTQVDAIRATSPGIFTQVQKALDASIQQALKKNAIIPYAAQRDMALLFDVNSTWSMTPEGVKTLQANAQEIAGAAAQDANDNGSGMPPRPPQRKADATARVNETATPTERRSFGGQIR